MFGGPAVAAEHRVVSVALRADYARERWHGVLVNEDNLAYAYGAGCVHGQLGLGGHFKTAERGGGFQLITSSPGALVSGGLRVTQIACGSVHTLALTVDQRVFSWGCNDEALLPSADGPGRIAPSGSDGRLGYDEAGVVHVPREIRPLRPEERYAVRRPAAVYLRASELLATLGRAGSGVELSSVQKALTEVSASSDGFVSVGLLAATEPAALAVARLLDPNVARLLDSPRLGGSVSSGGGSSAGAAAAVGGGSSGGSASFEFDETLPKGAVISALDIVLIGGRRWIKFEHPTFDWQAWVVSGTEGQAANGLLEEILEGDGVVTVAAGERHSAALSEHGRLYTWGNGVDGRLGLGDEEHALAPRMVHFADFPWDEPAGGAALPLWPQTRDASSGFIC